MCVCVYTHMYLYMCWFVCTYVYPCMWRPKIDVVCLSNHFLHFFGDRVSRDLKLTDGLDLLVSKAPGFSCLHLPSTVNTDAPRLCVPGSLDSRLCACMASTFLTPQPCGLLFFHFIYTIFYIFSDFCALYF